MNKVRVYLQDEAPTIGSGWREVIVTEENASGVRIKDQRTGARKRIKMPLWQEILKTAKSAPVEVTEAAAATEDRKFDPELAKATMPSIKRHEAKKPAVLKTAKAIARDERELAKIAKPAVPAQPKPVAAKPAKAVKIAKPEKKPVAAVRTRSNGALPSWEQFYDAVKAAGKAGLPFEQACKLFPDKTENAVNCLPEAANARLAARGDAQRIRRVKGANRAYVIA